MLKYSISCQELVKQDSQNSTKYVNVSVNLGLMFVIINNAGIKTNADVNAKNQLIKECVIKDLFGILVIVSVNVIKCVMLEKIQTENCECRKKLVAPLIEECTETVEEVKLAKITLAENENSCKCNPCTVYIVLMVVFFIICTGISSFFVYYNWSLVKNNVSRIKFGTRTQTTIY